MSSSHDLFYPNPVIHCPVSGAPIKEWKREGSGLIWRENVAEPELPEGAAEELKATRLEDATRVFAYSPEALEGKLKITLHIFVKEGVWNNSEICHVVDEGCGKVYYSTDE